jgi:hypothetical protein
MQSRLVDHEIESMCFVGPVVLDVLLFEFFATFCHKNRQANTLILLQLIFVADVIHYHNVVFGITHTVRQQLFHMIALIWFIVVMIIDHNDFRVSQLFSLISIRGSKNF